MKKVRITKIEDNSFNGQHPNGINKGFTAEGLELRSPKVGERYDAAGISTSRVVEIIDSNTIKTKYSTYKIEYLE